ncbi:MAG: hypothetical protein DI569_09200 [Sphingopyxis macrogoltabida]|uniref:Capsule biosynthesis protein n=1 Tax=Sphingopyxis macrogoltabida TaxID=33050 RepID=A0A2W5L1J6_SPHMC|nr:MAG: hypothetical protein DI569_09200 [Sphingopyxis macrogoltabida]
MKTGRPTSVTGLLAQAPVLRSPFWRRTILILALAICALLTFFPEKYRAMASLTPTDPSALGLSGTLGQFGSIGNVFGNQAAIEVSMKVARSDVVRNKVSERLNLPKRLGKTKLKTMRWLDRKVDVNTVRGGIIEFEISLRDAKLAEQIISVYGEAVRAELATISQNQTAYKRDILNNLITEASDRLAKSQAAYDTFRLQTRYSSPQAAIYAAGDRIPQLETLIRSKEVELNAARQFGTDDNIKVRQILAEMESLQRHLDEARSTSPAAQSSVGQVVERSTQVDKLRRDLDVAQGLFDNYKRFLQGTSVEDLTATANIRILEQAHIDTARQYNYIPLSIGILLLLVGLGIEFYLLRLPIGARVEP